MHQLKLIARCELTLPMMGSFTSISLGSVRTINKWDISLDLEDAEISEQDVTDYGEDDYLAEQAETLEDYYKH